MEQLHIELQIELRKGLESFRIGMVKMFDEMYVRKDHIIDGKQQKMMAGSDGEAHKNYSNLVMEENEAVANEVGVVAQAQVDTEPES